MFSDFKEKYLSDGQFYRNAALLAIPIILQNLITNFVSLLDNIMVGQTGTLPMSGVSIINQYIFIFNITIFGATAGAGIFGTQFFGKKDAVGQRYTVRFRLMLSILVVVLGALIFRLFDSQLIGLFLSGDDDPALIAETTAYAKEYLALMIWGLLPFGIGQAYASVIRECGETKIPMYASLAAIGINLFLDYGLIFGRLGMPEMGVAGAAIATDVAKYIECGVMIFWAHKNPAKNPYIPGLYRSMRIPVDLAGKMIWKSIPLLINEFLWALSISVVAQCYSVRGLDVVAARNIANTLTNLFNVIYIHIGTAIGIILGTMLGANRLREAKTSCDRLFFFSILVSFGVGLAMLPAGLFFPMIYKTDPDIKSLAAYFIIIQALATPLWAYTNSCYFTLRSGGKTGITFLFDFVHSWFFMIPLAYILNNLTDINIYMVTFLVTFSELFKSIIGFFMVRSGIWIQNIVSGDDDPGLADEADAGDGPLSDR